MCSSDLEEEGTLEELVLRCPDDSEAGLSVRPHGRARGGEFVKTLEEVPIRAGVVRIPTVPHGLAPDALVEQTTKGEAAIDHAILGCGEAFPVRVRLPSASSPESLGCLLKGPQHENEKQGCERYAASHP